MQNHNTNHISFFVFFLDPTVLQLEAEAARTLGKEAGIFLSSGTQGTAALLRLSIIIINLFIWVLNGAVLTFHQPHRLQAT